MIKTYTDGVLAVQKTEFTFRSSNGKTTLHAYIWAPDSTPKAVIQISHGITEHMGRYEEMGEYFASRGYAVAGHDSLGHGASMDPTDPKPMYFGPDGSWKFIVEDMRLCCEELKRRFPGVPYCLLGLSLGSFAVRCLQGQYPDIADMAVWAGTCHMSGAEIAIARAITKMEQRRFGDSEDTPLIHKLTMGTYNKYFEPCRTGSDWLLATPEALDVYVADPLCGDGFTVGSFRDLLDGMKQCCNEAFMQRMNRSTPILLMSGEKDPVGKFGKSVAVVRDQLRKNQFQHVEMQMFEGMRHDIFREKDHLTTFRYLESKLEKYL